MTTNLPSPGRRLRNLMADHTVALPGAINPLSARLIERHGFEALYLSGAVLANSGLGMPDVGLFTLTEAAEHARRVTAVCSLPAIMDADTGFGAGAENAARCVREYEHAGLAGLHLEDQEFPKRCGHLGGKSLVPQSEFCERIAAAAAAKRDRDFLIIARTDARGVTGYDDAVARANAYLQAGADAIFPEALQDREEFARFANDVRAPLLANMTEFGKTPPHTVQDFASYPAPAGCGYRLVIFPVTLQRIAMKAMDLTLAELKRAGSPQAHLDRMQTRQELYDLLDYKP
jgi:methylisocitrate lyase